MQDLKNFLESPETYRKIVAELNKHVDLQKVNRDHFIAGGSVANTIYSILYGGKPVINDIDVYRVSTHADSVKSAELKEVSEKKDIYEGIKISVGDMDIVSDTYNRIYLDDNGNQIIMKGHTREGIFNFIDYQFYKSPYSFLNHEIAVIESFDLNCCAAGISLREKKIYYTEQFLYFLKTKNLKIVNPSGPIQTAVRLFKKIEDLNCFCDVKKEMLFLSVATNSYRTNLVNRIVGPQTKQKYDKYQKFIEPYFVLRPIKDSDVNRLKKINLESFNAEGFWGYESIYKINISENFQSIPKLKKIWDLLYEEKPIEIQEKINKIFYKNFFTGNLTEDFWTTNLWVENESPDVIASYHSNRFTYEMLLAKKAYYDCEFNIEDVNVVDEFTWNYKLTRLFLKNTETVKETLEVINHIQSLIKKEGNWVLNFLNNYNVFVPKELDVIEVLSEIIEEEKVRGFIPISKQYDLNKVPYSKNIKQLMSINEIRNLDLDVSYEFLTNALLMNQADFFKIEIDNDYYVLMVEKPITTKWVNNKQKNIVEVIQPESFENYCFVIFDDKESIEDEVKNYQYGKRRMIHKKSYGGLNRNVTPERVKIITKELISFLNQNHLPKKYKIKVEAVINLKKFF